MKYSIRILFFFIFSNLSFSQIWDYPPEPISNWQYNQGMKKDSVKQIKVWNHIIIDSILTGKKELTLTQSLDFKGNTTQLIYKNGSIVEYDKYNHGFWGLKISDNKSYFQTVVFDDSMKIIKLTIDDFEKTVSYDSLNRPIRSVDNNSRIQLWKYKNNQLHFYQEFKDTLLQEERKYYFDSLKNTITYTTFYFDLNGEKYDEKDSVIALMNKKGNIIEISAFEINDDMTDLFYSFYYNSDGKPLGAGFKGECSSKHYEKQNNNGYTLYFERRDCNGNILSKTSYEYQFY